MSTNVGANASDVGLIVQGTLIFLSACIAVLGYAVQSRLQAKAHAKELELARTERHRDDRLKQLRENLRDVIGPMQGLSQQGQSMLFAFAISTSDKHSGLIGYWFDLMGGKEKALRSMAGEEQLFKAEPYLTPRIIERIRSDPDGDVAKDYRQVMKRALRVCFTPLSKLILRHMNNLHMPTRDAFLKKFPALKGDPQLRKKLLLSLVNWESAMADIVEEEWANGDYSHIFPRHYEFPISLVNYLIMMQDDVKDEIEKATQGTMSFSNVSFQQEQAEMNLEVKDGSKSSKYAAKDSTKTK